MPMFDDKRKIASVIISRLGEKEKMRSAQGPDGAVKDDSAPLMEASKKMIEAFSAKDANAFAGALRSFIEMVNEKHESDDSESVES